MELRIIVAGGRDFKNYNLLEDTLYGYLRDVNDRNIVDSPSQVKFISGCCKGADILGEQFACRHEYDVIRFPANWDKYGNAAGPIRNEQMAKYAVADGNRGVLVAFWDGKSKGTKSMIGLAKKYGLEVHVVRY